MDVASTILRALDSFQLEVEADRVEGGFDIEDIKAAREWTRGMYFEWTGGRFAVVDRTRERLDAILVRLPTEEEAAEYIEKLPDYETGRYAIDDMLLGALESGLLDHDSSTATEQPDLQERIKAAHAKPHMHEIGGRPVGHHRLYALGLYNDHEVEVVCGLPDGHEAHPWAEDGRTYQCPGRTRTGMPITNAPEAIEILDRLDETFRASGEQAAHHHIRAVAHDMGWHLSSCTGGRRQAPEGPNW